MTTDEALRFLAQHQPLPYDSDYTQELADQFKEVIEHFEANPDERCVRPLLFAMGPGGGLGMFDRVEMHLASYPPDVLVPIVAEAIQSPQDGTQFRALGLAADIKDRRLLPLARQKMRSPLEHVREAASAALFCMTVPEDQPWLEEELANARDEQIADNWRDVLDKLQE